MYLRCTKTTCRMSLRVSSTGFKDVIVSYFSRQHGQSVCVGDVTEVKAWLSSSTETRLSFHSLPILVCNTGLSPIYKKAQTLVDGKKKKKRIPN